MRRIQIHLDEDLDDELARRAAGRGIPKAALIRELLSMHVKPPSADPSDRLIGIYEGSAGESTSVDDVV